MKIKIYKGIIIFSLFIICLMLYKTYECNKLCQDKKDGCRVLNKDITVRFDKKFNIAIRRHK